MLVWRVSNGHSHGVYLMLSTRRPPNRNSHDDYQIAFIAIFGMNMLIKEGEIEKARDIIELAILHTNEHPELVQILDIVNRSITNAEERRRYNNLPLMQKIVVTLTWLAQKIISFFSMCKHATYSSEGSFSNEAVEIDLHRRHQNQQDYRSNHLGLFSQKNDIVKTINELVCVESHKPAT